MPAPRNIYQDGVDFKALAAVDGEFRDRLKSNTQLDFSDPGSVLQLTKSLLRRDFDIDIDLPPDRLCPPVPNRFSYILWLQDLVDSTSPGYREGYDPQREVVGVDVGTGASAIYPLLGTRQRPNWRFVATECDDKSCEYAQANVSRNEGLSDRIRVVRTEREGDLVPVGEMLEMFDRIDFVQTNPPFYTSSHDHLTSSKRKSRPPNSVCTGSASEMITSGGEIGFVSRLISQSSAEPTDAEAKVQWWSSMLGKLSSVAVVVEELKREGCDNWAVGQIVQGGGKTRRWVVAWSWWSLRPSVAVARGVKIRALVKGGGAGTVALTKGSGGVGVVTKRHGRKQMEDDDKDDDDDTSTSGLEGGLLPFPSEFEFTVQAAEMDDMATGVNNEIKQLPAIRWQWKHALGIGLGVAQDGDCWSRKARRRMKVGGQGEGQGLQDQTTDHDVDENVDEEDGKEPQLVFKIQVRQQQVRQVESAEAEEASVGVVVTLRWLQGRDHVLFESFCGWLKRRLDLDRR